MFDTEKFIALVECRPVLYDVNLKNYNNRDEKSTCWNQIAKEMYEGWGQLPNRQRREAGKDLVRKWKAIRDNFVREHKTQIRIANGEQPSKKRKYIYYDRLLFLMPHIKGGENVSRVQHEADPEGENTAQSSDIEEYTLLENVPNGDESSLTGNRNDIQRRRKLINIRKKDHMKMSKKQMQAMMSGITTAMANLLVENASSAQKEEEHDKFGNRAFLLSCLPILDSLALGQCLDARMRILKSIQDMAADNLATSTTENLPNLQACGEVFIKNEEHIMG